MVRGSVSRHMVEQVEWRYGAVRVSEQRGYCSAGKARHRELVGSPGAELAAAVVAMVAMEDYDEHEEALEKAASLDAHLMRVYTLPVLGFPEPNMMRPEELEIVAQVTAKPKRNGSAMPMIQEEAVYSDVHSDLNRLSAKAHLDGGSKGRILA